MNPLRVAVAGGGIGGLAAALALARRGAHTVLHEQATVWGEIGAGVQLGANAVRVLQALGAGDALRQVAAVPRGLRVMGAPKGTELARLELGERHRRRYGAPYLTLHRADLHAVLRDAVQAIGAAELHLGRTVQDWRELLPADAVVAADGLWSPLRRSLLPDEGLPVATGHLALRGMVAQSALPAAQRSEEVCVWLGPGLHAVRYPIRGGELLNWVIVLHDGVFRPRPRGANAEPDAERQSWDLAPDAGVLERALAQCTASLRDAAACVPQWRCWWLSERPPLCGPHQMAQGPVALLGDAAHPMRPYLAQGAGMAIEDALVLAQCLQASGAPVEQRLARYAQLRWQRCAQVQARAQRNGRIFHAQGLLRVARDLTMRGAGGLLLDLPWLYRGGPVPPAQPALVP